ncbi:hypothetical protein ACTNEO_13720 [Gracilibacillus sp. HCP3S3_G5_1]|uniref:hypothetical protein n=1 Tax=unclassified Gracilibacillus TaxID=2625209 RepID=UPI003F8B0A9B
METNHAIFTKEVCENKLDKLITVMENIEKEWNLTSNNRNKEQYWSLSDIYKKEGA